jgi:CDP-glucose 4,6-dehydratase
MVAPDLSFWRGKRVLVTGHTGFKGSWLALWLQKLDCRLAGVALEPPTNPSLFKVARIADTMDSHIADVRNLEMLSRLVVEFQPEIIFHLAAQSLVRASYRDPIDTFSTNVMGTVNVLDTARRCESVRAVVVVTSDKCYENREWLWGYRENDRMGGHDPYSSSKGCAELVTSAYRRSFFNDVDRGDPPVGVASARAGNVIGGGDWAVDRLVPDMIRAFAAHEPVNIRNPDAIRPWQHVLEPLSGYLMLAERLQRNGPEFAEAWNFGPLDEDAKPVSWIAQTLVKRWGNAAAWQVGRSKGPHEAAYLKLDCSKARARLGWRARWPLAEALARVVDWHKAHASGDDMRAFSLRQIQEYTDERPSH